MSPALRFAITLALFSVALPAAATNGYFAHGYSASQRALGGAGTALAEDALVTTVNPAGSVRVGTRWDANVSLFVPIREYEAEASTAAAGFGIVEIDAGRVRSNHSLFAIPGFAWTAPLDERFQAGIAIYGNGGLNTVYKEAEGGASFARLSAGNSLLAGLLGLSPAESRCQGSFGGGSAKPGNSDLLGFCGNGNGTASVDLIQLFVAPNLAWRLGETTSVGISPIFAAQRFEAKGLGAFARFSNAPDRVTDQGFSFSYGGGARLGVLTELLPGVDLGASWQSRIRMSRFKEYEGLFAEQGDFDIPSSWNAGLAFRLTPNQRLLVDYQRINFNEIASVGNRLGPDRFVNDCALPRLTGATTESAACLGASGGPGFGWQNIAVWKAGYQLVAGDWRWRLGYSRTQQPIPSDEILFNVLAPGVVEQHYTAGIGWQPRKGLGVDLGLMYAPGNPVRGRNPLSNVGLLAGGQVIAAGPDADDQDITLDMHQYEVTLGLSYAY